MWVSEVKIQSSAPQKLEAFEYSSSLNAFLISLRKENIFSRFCFENLFFGEPKE